MSVPSTPSSRSSFGFRDGQPLTNGHAPHSPRYPPPSPASAAFFAASPVKPNYSHSELIRELRVHSTDKAAVALASTLSTLTLHPTSITPPLSCLAPTVAPDLPTLLSLLYTVQHSPPPTTLPTALYRHAHCVFVQSLTFYVHHHVAMVVLDLVRGMQPHVTYWEEMDAAPYTLFASINRQITAVVQLKLHSSFSNPSSSSAANTAANSTTPPAPSASSSSFDSVSTASASHKLRRLLRMRRIWCTRAGRLAYRAHVLRYWLAQSQSTEQLSAAMAHCYAYIDATFMYVSGHKPALPTASNHSALLLLEDTILGLDELQEWFQQQLLPLHKPSHIQRHWLRYITLTAVSLVTARYTWKRRAAISLYAYGTWESLLLFYQDHLVEPLTNIYQSVFSTFHNRSTLQNAHDNLVQSQAVLSNMILDYAHKSSSYTDRPAVELQRLAERQDMSLVMADYVRDVNKPWRTLLAGDLLQEFLIQIQQVKVSGEAAMVTMDQLLSANAINFNILATIPAVIVAALLVALGRNLLVRLMMRGRDRSSVYESVRRRMRAIETLCLEYLYYQRPGERWTEHVRLLQQWREREEMRERGEDDDQDADAQQTAEEDKAEQAQLAAPNASDIAHPLSVVYMPAWAYGQLLLNLHSLPAVHNLLDSAEKIGWGRALELLCSVQLTCEQRVMLIATMNRSFDFLSQLEAWVPVDDAV